MRTSLTYRLLRLVWRRLTFSRRRLLKRIANGERVLAALGREVDSLLGVNTGPRLEDFKFAPGQFIAVDSPGGVAWQQSFIVEQQKAVMRQQEFLAQKMAIERMLLFSAREGEAA